MKVVIIIGKIQRNAKWQPLLLDDPVNCYDPVAPFFKYGKRVMKCVAKLSKKEAGRVRTKSWSIPFDHRPNVADEEIRAAAIAQAERWRQKILNPVKPEVQPQEVALMNVEPSFENDLLA